MMVVYNIMNMHWLMLAIYLWIFVSSFYQVSGQSLGQNRIPNNGSEDYHIDFSKWYIVDPDDPFNIRSSDIDEDDKIEDDSAGNKFPRNIFEPSIRMENKSSCIGNMLKNLSEMKIEKETEKKKDGKKENKIKDNHQDVTDDEENEEEEEEHDDDDENNGYSDDDDDENNGYSDDDENNGYSDDDDENNGYSDDDYDDNDSDEFCYKDCCNSEISSDSSCRFDFNDHSTTEGCFDDSYEHSDVDDGWYGKVGGDYNCEDSNAKKLSHWDGHEWDKGKKGKKGKDYYRSEKKFRIYDIRERLHRFLSKANSDTVYGDDGLIVKANPRSVFPFLDSIKKKIRGGPKTKDKLVINKTPYRVEFTLQGRRWKDKNLRVFVEDINDCLIAFDELDDEAQVVCVNDALDNGSIFACYPIEKIELKDDRGEHAEVALLKTVLKEVLCEYVDKVFEFEVAKLCARKMSRIAFGRHN